MVSAGLGLKFIFKQGGRTNRCPTCQGVEGVQGDTPLREHRQHATAMACETLAGVESPNLNDFCRSTRGSYRSNPYRLLRSHYNQLSPVGADHAILNSRAQGDHTS